MNQEFFSFGIGRLTKAPLFTKGQKADGKDDRAWFVVATNRPKNADGTRPEAKYTPVVCWGVTARNAAEYLEKGQVVAVMGRLNTRAEKREDGSGKYDHYCEVVADRLIYGPKAKNTPAPVAQAQAPAQTAAAPAANPLAGMTPEQLAQMAQLAGMFLAAQSAPAAGAAPPAEAESDNPFQG